MATINNLLTFSPERRRELLSDIPATYHSLELINTNLSAMPFQELIDFLAAIPEHVTFLSLENAQLGAVTRLAEVFQHIPKHIKKLNLGNNHLGSHPELGAALKELKNIDTLKFTGNQLNEKNTADLTRILQFNPNIKLLTLSAQDITARTEDELKDFAAILINIDILWLYNDNHEAIPHASARKILQYIKSIRFELGRSSLSTPWAAIQHTINNLPLSSLNQPLKEELRLIVRNMCDHINVAKECWVSNYMLTLEQYCQQLELADDQKFFTDKYQAYKDVLALYDLNFQSLFRDNERLTQYFQAQLAALDTAIQNPAQFNRDLFTAPTLNECVIHTSLPPQGVAATQPAGEPLPNTPESDSTITRPRGPQQQDPAPSRETTKRIFSPKSMTMLILGGFIAVVGIAAVALAFTLLHAATLGLSSIITLGTLGIIATLGGAGFFATGFAKSNRGTLQPQLEESFEGRQAFLN